MLLWILAKFRCNVAQLLKMGRVFRKWRWILGDVASTLYAPADILPIRKVSKSLLRNMSDSRNSSSITQQMQEKKLKKQPFLAKFDRTNNWSRSQKEMFVVNYPHFMITFTFFSRMQIFLVRLGEAHPIERQLAIFADEREWNNFCFRHNDRYFRQLALLRDTPVYAQIVEKRLWNSSRAAYLHLLWISKEKDASYYISLDNLQAALDFQRKSTKEKYRKSWPSSFGREMMNSYRRFRAAVAFKRDWVAPPERVGSTSSPPNLVFVPGAMNNLLRANFWAG